MFDLIDFMQWTGLSTLAVVVYVLAFNNVKSSVRRTGPYSVPNWNFHLKKYWAQHLLRKKATTDEEKAVDFQQFESEQLIGDNQLHSSQFIFGIDTNGNSMIINLAIGKDGYAEIWLSLRLADGRVFALPAHPNVHSTKIGPINEDRFDIAGLTFQCLQPYVKWRISYAGLLRKVDSEGGDDELHFVKFNFFWTMCGHPQHWPADWSDELKATALATEPWRHSHWLEYLSTNGYGGFDQFGSLFGQVHVTGAGDQRSSETRTTVLNLPGVRQRRWSSYDQEKVRRSCSIVGVCADGSVYVLGAHSLERNLTNAQFGHVRTSNGIVTAIDSTDFHLAEFAENPDHISAVLNLQFTAAGRTFVTTVYAKPDTRLPLSGNVPRGWSENVVSAEIGLNGEHGAGIIRLWYANSTSSGTAVSLPASKPAPLLVGGQQRPTRTKIAYWFTDAGAQSEAIAGGKGASLALLTCALNATDNAVVGAKTFKVPAGFVMSASAYDLQLSQHAEIRAAIDTITDIAYKKVAGDLQSACDRACALIESRDLEPEIEQTIDKYVRDLTVKLAATGAPCFRLAVRSSAIGEDGDEASAAGQNETLLGVRDAPAVCDAVRKCWASLYTRRSVEYRRQHLQPISAQMAVVVQQMVAADVAGVMFTREPHSGDPRRMLVTSNYGLGETVVSGQVEPDTFVVAKGLDGGGHRLRIIDSQLGTKTHAMQMSAAAGGETIVLSEVSVAEQQRATLTDEEILRLAHIGVMLEKMYGNARDIEWALFENEYHILQSRPITITNSTLSNWELLHERDTAVMSTDDLFSFANVGEVLPGCSTPLTSSTVVQTLQRATLMTINPHRRHRGRFLNSFAFSHHRLMFDVYNVFLILREVTVSMADTMLSISICGNEYITPDIHRVSVHRNGVQTGAQKIGSMLEAFRNVWNNKSAVAKSKRLSEMIKGRYSPANLDKHFADHDAVQIAGEIAFELDDVDRMEQAFIWHSYTTKVSTISQLIAMSTLIEGGTDLTQTHYADLALILSTCSDVESAEVPAMLEEMANAIYIAGGSADFVTVPTGEGEVWLGRNCPAAARMFRNFISRHGHRTFKEFELKSVSWDMHPETIIEMLQRTCRHANDVLAKQSKRGPLTNAQIVEQLRSPKKSATRRVIGYLLTLCRRSMQRREKTKSHAIAYVHELRKAYRHLAELLVHAGLLPEAQLIFMLTRDELTQLIRPTADVQALGYRASKTALLSKAQRRQRLFPAWNELRFDELNAYLIQPKVDQESDGISDAADGAVVVSGTSVCEGVISGRACVIDSFAQVDQIRAGDILVTHGTDIAWSTYFPILGGVVTELGGLISHGAVVAREYGLPCIVGATNATRRLRNGERVTLNATKGVIYHEVAEESEA